MCIHNKNIRGKCQEYTQREHTHSDLPHGTDDCMSFLLSCFYFSPPAPLGPFFFGLHTPAILRILLSLVFLCVTVSQMSCIRLLTRCLSAWLSSPRLYVISPGVLCLCVYLRIMVRACGCRAESVGVVAAASAAAAAAQSISNLPSFEAFYVSRV